MSIHLQSVPIPFGMDPATYFRNRVGPGAKVAKVNTNVTDYEIMKNIIANSTVGFKSKRALRNFQNRCIMYFEDNGQTVDITFIGNFTNNEVHSFVSNLNREFNQRNKQPYSNDIRTHFKDTINKNKKENKRKVKKKQERLMKKRKHQNEINVKNKKHEIDSELIKKENEEIHEIIEDTPREKILIEETILPENQFIISSNLRDKSIIDQVLNESYIGYNSREQLENFQNIGKISFNKTINGTYDFVFIGNYNEEEAKKYIDTISEEYALIVQEQTYLKVIEKIKKENLTLESEIVDSEDSIVLTLNI